MPADASRRPGKSVRTKVREVAGDRVTEHVDVLATEEPLEIRLAWPGQPARALVVTMRTPGADVDLAVGFLRSEGVIESADDVTHVAYCVDRALAAEQRYNVMTVNLTRPPARALEPRYGGVSSACGVCGKQSLDALELTGEPSLPAGPVISPEVLRALPDRLRPAQEIFARTGGLHGAGLFTAGGEPACVREDVGRHNAVDKIVGWSLLERRMPLHEHALLVSGRAGFEIAQKALAAGIPFLAAVGAPSSLAVDLARRFGMTLVGFLRGDRYVIYAGAERCPDPA